MDHAHCIATIREPWNKGKLVGLKVPFKPEEIWASGSVCSSPIVPANWLLFNLAIGSTLRACDLVKLLLRDVCHVGAMASRAIVRQQKTQRPE